MRRTAAIAVLCCAGVAVSVGVALAGERPAPPAPAPRPPVTLQLVPGKSAGSTEPFKRPEVPGFPMIIDQRDPSKYTMVIVPPPPGNYTLRIIPAPARPQPPRSDLAP